MSLQGRDDFETLEHRPRRLLSRILAGLLGIVPIVLAVIALGNRIQSCRDSAPPPPGIEVDVDAAGRATVRGCAAAFEFCVRDAKDREMNRPGGGHYRAVVHVAAGAPPEAIREARGALMDQGFMPAAR